MHLDLRNHENIVSTHSRLKAAASVLAKTPPAKAVSTHSRLKAAGQAKKQLSDWKRFNTQPPKGGCLCAASGVLITEVSTHSRLKAAGGSYSIFKISKGFQHTAA